MAEGASGKPVLGWEIFAADGMADVHFWVSRGEQKDTVPLPSTILLSEKQCRTLSENLLELADWLQEKEKPA